MAVTVSSRVLLERAEQAHMAAVAVPRRGLEEALAVAGEARTARDAEALVVALRTAGWAARELYDHGAARRHLDEAVRVARRAGLPDRLGQTLLTRSAAHLEAGRHRPARRDLAAAAAVAGRGTRAEVAFAQGLLDDSCGRHAAATTAYRRAARTATPEQRHVRVKALNNLGLTLLRLGQVREAERCLAQAAGPATQSGPAAGGIVAENQARAAVEAGRPVEALGHFARAEALLREGGAPVVELHLGRAGTLLALRLLAEAAQAADAAVAELERHDGGALVLAEALVLRARIAVAAGEPARAASVAQRAAEVLARQRRPGWRAAAELLAWRATAQAEGPGAVPDARLREVERRLTADGDVAGVVEVALLRGDVAAVEGRVSDAARAWDRAAGAARRAPVLLRQRGRLARALRDEAAGDPVAVRRTCRAGLHELAVHRASFASAELRASASEHGRDLARLGLRAALRSGSPQGVWTWLERTQVTVLLRTPPRTGAADGPAAALLAELRTVERDLQGLSDDAGSRTSLLARRRGLERALRAADRSSPGTAAAGGSAPREVTEAVLRRLRSTLADRVLLQYGTSDGRVVAVAVSARRVAVADLGPVQPVREAVASLGFALARLARPGRAATARAARAGASAARTELARLLVAPLSRVVAPAERAVVVAPGPLLGLPWGLLPGLSEVPVAAAPSALAWAQAAARRAASDRVVLVAGPDVPGAVSETAALAARYPQALHLRGGAATCDAVRRAADGARVVHLACHGRLRADAAGFSGLELADGPLTVHELGALPRAAHHWVLAACDVAATGHLPGVELEGVLAALLSAGAATVTASGAPVPDSAATTDLMVRLHEALAAGLPPDAALLRARRSVDLGDDATFAASAAFAVYGC